MACINAAVADHFKMFFRYMADQPCDEFHGGNGFTDEFIIFVAVVMERDMFAIITVDSGGCNHRTAKITANVLDDSFRITFCRFSIDIEAMFVPGITSGLDGLKGVAKPGMQFVKERSAESVAQVSIVKMVDMSPKFVITVSAFRDKTVNVRIPFQIPAEGVQDHDEARREVF